MSVKYEFLVATVCKNNIDFLKDMNISLPTIVSNQFDCYKAECKENYIMITTPTKGVGKNRNIGLNLSDAEYVFFVDDDMVFYNDVNKIFDEALNKYPDADVIIFNFDYMKNGEKIRDRIKKQGKIKFFNCLNYGICCALVKNSKIKQMNINFSNFFGGGCLYSCGEDSLFYLDCIRKKLKVYTYLKSVGINEYRESTWFKGYNEKFFYDKGAWIACAFPILKHFVKWYFIFRFRKLSKISIRDIKKFINKGIRGYKSLKNYNSEIS